MLHGVQQGDEDTGTGSADGMAQRNSAAVDVQLALVEVQSLADGNRLSGKSLVGLDQIHVVHGQAGLGHDLLGGGDGAQAHDLGLNTGQSTGDPGSQRLNAQLLGLLLAHDDQSSSAVVDGGGVGGGDDAVLLEAGLQLAQNLHGAHAGAFVGIKHGVALLALDDNGNDLVLESAVGNSLGGLLLRMEGKLVQLLTADGVVAVLLLVGLVGADVLGGHAHVHVEAGGIPQSVVDHRVDQLALAHGGAHAVAVAALHHGERSHVHVLHAACNDDVGIAGLDHLGSHVDAVQTGAADDVDGDGGGLDGQAGLQGSLTSDVLAQTGLDDAAHVDMVDLLRLNVGAVQSLLDDDGAQLSSGDIGEGAAELANGSTAGAGDDDLFHK